MLRGQNAYAERAACPLYTAIAVIEGRWKPMVFQRLLERPRGFGELRRAIPRVTTKVLREQLRQMMADDLITRDELTPRHLGVRYAVSTYGATLGPVFDALWRWGGIHLARHGSARGTVVAAPLGRPNPDAQAVPSRSRGGAVGRLDHLEDS
jgi:DNA-binding HxlR family transcriptional regulator